MGVACIIVAVRPPSRNEAAAGCMGCPDNRYQYGVDVNRKQRGWVIKIALLTSLVPLCRCLRDLSEVG